MSRSSSTAFRLPPAVSRKLAGMMEHLSEAAYELPHGGPLYIQKFSSDRYQLSLTSNLHLPITDKSGFPLNRGPGTMYPLQKAMDFLCRAFEFFRTPPTVEEVRKFRNRFQKDKSESVDGREAMVLFLNALLLLIEQDSKERLDAALSAYLAFGSFTRDALPVRFVLPMYYAERKHVPSKKKPARKQKRKVA